MAFLTATSMMLAAAALRAGPADARVLRSGPARVALIELYTSEGCSSCPPAEKWLGELRGDAGLWRHFVPVAFHVNYWDHLGWRDALAAKSYTDREYAYASAWRASSVYTPCFVRNGREWRPRGGLAAERDTPEAGTLTLTWEPARHRGRVEFVPAAGPAKRPKLEATVALLGGGIVSNVRKGENAGRELRHEFAALRVETVALTRGADGAWTANISLPPRQDIAVARRALAAWVSEAGKPAPLQATGGWLE